MKTKKQKQKGGFQKKVPLDLSSAPAGKGDPRLPFDCTVCVLEYFGFDRAIIERERMLLVHHGSTDTDSGRAAAVAASSIPPGSYLKPVALSGTDFHRSSTNHDDYLKIIETEINKERINFFT